MNRTERGARRYYVEITAVVLLLALMFFGRPLLHTSTSSGKFLLAVATLVPMWLVLAVVVRFFLAADEYIRRRMVNALAIAALFDLIFSVSYAVLSRPLGLRPLFIGISWLILGGAFGACFLVMNVRDAIRDDRFAKEFWPFGWLMSLSFVAFFYAVAARFLHWPYGDWVLWGGVVWGIPLAGVRIFVSKRRV
jgi:hypothetical protein